MKTTRTLLLFLCVFLICSLTVNANTERILNFHSDIKVDSTGRVLVTETILINVTGESISRGIVRTIPIYRTDTYNRKKRIDINILSVERNGFYEDFSTQRENDDFAVYIGNANYILPPDVYRYTIKYESYGHVGFFDNYDEIYWNVTGNDWAFPIDSASATVHVPKGAKIMTNACYTGKSGSTATKCNYTIDGDRIVNFVCATNLNKNEGFTIATSFTPFIINRSASISSQSSAFKEWWSSFQKNLPLIMLISCLLALGEFIRRAFKKSVKMPTVVPTFNPPQGKSAAILRYLYTKKSDNKALAASVISLAVKGYITIKQNEDSYSISLKESDQALSPDEQTLKNELFDSSEDRLSISDTYSSRWNAIRSLWKESITKIFDLNDYFSKKSSIVKLILKPAIILYAIWCMVLAIFTDLSIADLVIVIIGVLFSSFYSFCIYCVFNMKLGNYRIITYIWRGISTLVIAILFRGIIGMIFESDSPERAWTFVFLFLICIICLLFIIYYPKYTRKGADILSEIEGFRMYLVTAEENRLNFLTPPEQTPEQFEKMLPYAIALDLEIAWANKFSKILEQYNYQPTWIQSSSSFSDISEMRSFSNSFSSTLSKSVTMPPSKSSARDSSSSSSSDPFSSRSDSRSSGSSSWSSGSSGGGSSGGGGGGGGGRGW